MLTCQYLPRWLDKRFTSLRTTHRVFTMPTNRLETQNIWRGSKTTHGRKHPPLLYYSYIRRSKSYNKLFCQINLEELSKEEKVEQWLSTFSIKSCLKALYKEHSKRKCCSFSIFFKEQYWHKRSDLSSLLLWYRVFNIAALIYYYNVYGLLIVIELALTWLCCIVIV
jgi:hypothetical protein